MTVSEVREVMRRMWSHNSDVLRLLFAKDSRLSVLGSMNLQQHAARGRDFEQAYNMFFLQVLPVAPNRVRPVSILGDQSFEHPHNVALTRVRMLCQMHCSSSEVLTQHWALCPVQIDFLTVPGLSPE